MGESQLAGYGVAPAAAPGHESESSASEDGPRNGQHYTAGVQAAPAESGYGVSGGVLPTSGSSSAQYVEGDRVDLSKLLGDDSSSESYEQAAPNELLEEGGNQYDILPSEMEAARSLSIKAGTLRKWK